MLDILTANFMLPLGGLAMAVFAGWFMARRSTLDELRLPDGPLYRAWHFAVRYVSPIGVLLVFMSGMGVI
jgi:NSS family neurotransmitter:Na+ symporter